MASIYRDVFVSLCLRFIVVAYSVYHDASYDVPYTDVDMYVYLDAASRVDAADAIATMHRAFDAPTYRYTPLLALTLSTLGAHVVTSKVIFCIADVLVGVLIHAVAREITTPANAVKCATLWLYNPLAINIATRGSCDAMMALVPVTAALAAFARLDKSSFAHSLDRRRLGLPLLSGLCLGVAAHARIYPVLYGPCTLVAVYHAAGLAAAAAFACGCALGGGVPTAICLWTDTFAEAGDMPYLSHALLYHTKRVDFRHNFAPHWLPAYLSRFRGGDADDSNGTTYAEHIVAGPNYPQLAAVAATMWATIPSQHAPGAKTRQLVVCYLCSTMAFVALNKVITAQYFVWWIAFLSFLPIYCSRWRGVLLSCAVWVVAHGAWLACAYQLEFTSPPPTGAAAWTHAASCAFVTMKCLLVCVTLQLARKENVM